MLGLTRRDLLSKCYASGLLIAAPALTEPRLLSLWLQAESKKKPTPPNDLGPFYKADAPRETKLSRPGDPGLPLKVTGTVYDTRGEVLPGALIEIWHADPFGQYDNQGFHYRALFTASSGGSYGFDTNMPGHYPDRVAQHIHYKVTAPGHKALVTQLYFATDPAFEGDPDRNYRKDPLLQTRELIRPVRVHEIPGSIRAAVDFEVVLETL